MNRKFFWSMAVFMLCLVVLSACGQGIPVTALKPADQAATQDALIQQAVQGTATQMAQQMLIAQLQTQVAQAGKNPQIITATTQPTAVAAAAVTATPLPPTPTPVTPTATATATYTATAVPPTRTPTATAIPCNAAQFVTDISVPDGSTISAGSTFTKTWRLKNTGACTWTTNYDIVFVSGDQMNGPAAIDLPGSVAPGQVIDVSVNLTAPASSGHYRGNWRLRDASGILFGVGHSSTTFYVDINVSVPQSKYPLDFIASMCLADWTSGAGHLACPGADNDSSGFVQRVDKPTLESGYVDDESALLMFPQMVTNGVIQGKYPSLHIESGYHFLSIIGCGYNMPSCDVNFRLDYQIGNGSIQNIGIWHEVYDKKFFSVDVDLVSLVGKDVKFILTVNSNGSYQQDRVLWLLPRIVKK